MAKLSDETDTIEAFVALGGSADKMGAVSAEKLSRLCKVRAHLAGQTSFMPSPFLQSDVHGAHASRRRLRRR